MNAPVKLSEIDFTADTQVRVAINRETVADYAEQMEAGEKFPAAEVFHDGTRYLIADGWHRLLAARELQWNAYPCVVTPGSRLDAVRFALGANVRHGLQRTNADKRKAVEIALKEWKTSDREIAQICAVSHTLVSAIRNNQLAAVATVRPATVGADGKTRKAPVRKARPAPPADTAKDETPAVPAAAAVPTLPAPELPAWSIAEALVRHRDAVETELAVCPVADLVQLKKGIRDNVAALCAPAKDEPPDSAFGSRKTIPPLPEWVTAYSASIGYPLDGDKWCDSYQAKGWTVGKNKVKDWQACVRTWKANGHGAGTIALGPKRTTKPTDYDHI